MFHDNRKANSMKIIEKMEPVVIDERVINTLVPCEKKIEATLRNRDIYCDYNGTMAAEQKYFESDAAFAAWDITEARRVNLQLMRYRKDIALQCESYLIMEETYALWMRVPTERTWTNVLSACDMYVEEEEPIMFYMIAMSRGSPTRKEQVYAHYRRNIRHYHDHFLARRQIHEKEIVQQELKKKKQREQIEQSKARLARAKAEQAAKEARWRLKAQMAREHQEMIRRLFGEDSDDEYRAVMEE